MRYIMKVFLCVQHVTAVVPHALGLVESSVCPVFSLVKWSVEGSVWRTVGTSPSLATASVMVGSEWLHL